MSQIRSEPGVGPYRKPPAVRSLLVGFVVVIAVALPALGVLPRATSAGAPHGSWAPLETSSVPSLDHPGPKATLPSYNVSFTERGLPGGTRWEVTGFITNTTSFLTWAQAPGPTSTTLSNGTFDFFVEPVAGYHGTPVGGTFNVSGGTVNISIDFAPGNQTLQSVPIFEAGLPAGTTWDVDLNGTVHTATVEGPYGGRVVVLVANGTYPFQTSAGPQYTSPWRIASGQFVVEGRPWTAYTVPFERAYRVTFTETGLAPGTGWWADLQTTPGIVVSNTSSIDLPASNGTYEYSVGSLNPYLAAPTPSSGNLSVSGTNESVQVRFDELTYPVEFVQFSLPNGTTWWVNLTGGASVSSDRSTLTIPMPLGANNFTEAVANKSYAPASPGGTVQVDGPARLEFILSFDLVTFGVAFAEAGLPVGLNWSLTWNGSIVSGSGDLHLSSFPNGTYAFTVHPPPGYTAQPEVGRLTVAGSAVTETVTFVPTRTGSSTLGLLGVPWWPEGIAVLAGSAIALAAVALLWKARRAPKGPPGPSGPSR